MLSSIPPRLSLRAQLPVVLNAFASTPALAEVAASPRRTDLYVRAASQAPASTTTPPPVQHGDRVLDAYQRELGRVPNLREAQAASARIESLESRGVAPYLALGHLLDDLARSDEGLRREVARRYEEVLGRTPSAAEIEPRMPHLAALRDQGMESPELRWFLRKELALSPEGQARLGVDGTIDTLAREFFGRPASAGELAGLRSFFTGADHAGAFDALAAHLHRSDEFARAQIVRRAYIGALGREPDAGSESWLSSVRADLERGMSRAEAQANLQARLSRSDEGLAVQVSGAFRRALGRPLEDPEYFISRMREQNVPRERWVGVLEKQFFTSEEHVAKFGPEMLVRQVYRDVLGREADPDGLRDHIDSSLQKLSEGMSPGELYAQLAEAFSKSDEYARIHGGRAPSAVAPAEEVRSSQAAEQMRALLAHAEANHRGASRGRCYEAVAAYIEAVGYGNIAPGTFPIPSQYWAHARDFAVYMNMGDNTARHGLVRLPISNPYDAPPGAIVVVEARSPGTAHPTAGDISIATGEGRFINDGPNMGYGNPASFEANGGVVLGVYVPA